MCARAFAAFTTVHFQFEQIELNERAKFRSQRIKNTKWFKTQIHKYFPLTKLK